MGRQRPRSVDRATQVMGVLLLLAAAAVVLTAVLEDDIVRTWAEGNPSARNILATDGLEVLKQSPITPAFVPVVLVLFVVMALLVAVLAAFFRLGHHWARVSLTVTVLLTAVSTVAVLLTSTPVVFEVLAGVSLVLEALLVWLLWRRDTSEFLAGAWQDRHPAPEAARS